MRKLYGVFFLFIICFTIGYSVINHTTYQYQISRDPAAVKNSFDLTHLSGESLQEAIHQKLVAKLEIIKSAEETSISVGHYSFVNSQGEKKLACREFDQVSFEFEADGSSVSNGKPTMEVQGRCDFSPDLLRTQPLSIPVARILGEAPGDGDFTTQNVYVKFSNLAEVWPRTWILKSIKLSHSKGKVQAVIVESEEVTQYLGHPVVITW
ncbi:MAG: hypothetical protein AAGB31_01895 [Bdellovibrio sp.]